MDIAIYATVIRRLSTADHGWDKAYNLVGLYVLDHAVPGVEEP